MSSLPVPAVTLTWCLLPMLLCLEGSHNLCPIAWTLSAVTEVNQGCSLLQEYPFPPVCLEGEGVVCILGAVICSVMHGFLLSPPKIFKGLEKAHILQGI